MKATIFRNFTEPVEEKSLILITKDIAEGKYKAEVEAIRALIVAGNKPEADKRKKKLPAFAASATFSDGRKMDFFKEYSGFIILDIDNLAPLEYSSAIEKAKSCPYTFCAFRSPGGNGLKILVKVTSKEQHHSLAFGQVADYYANLLGVAVDPSGKDITRLCFMSYDPETFKNLESELFPVQTSTIQLLATRTRAIGMEPPHENSNSANLAKYAKQFQNCVEFTLRKEKFEDGHRNNFVHLLACNCNRAGIPQVVALQLIQAEYNYDDKEVSATVKSAYENNPGEFASFANFASAQSTKEEQSAELEEQLSAAPFIPDEVFNKLPRLLQEGCKVFTDKRERDIFLTGAITILSGCFTSITGIYDSKIVYPNIYCFVIAPAASGKGALVFARRLGDVIHNRLLAQSIEEQQRYESQLEQFKNAKRFKKRTEPAGEDQPPEQPKFKVLFIPANSSKAAVMDLLNQNGGIGIICETEADTMGNTLKQDWGGYSDLLRKAFHHETASSSRKINREYIQVQLPRLSVALSGTPSQVAGLISSAEDGLFSRFLFYVFKSIPQWRDVSPGNGLNLTTHFEKLANQLSEMATGLNQTETTFNLTTGQWDQLNQKFKGKLNEVSAFVSQDATSTVKRLGLITFRVAMILAVIRNGEQGTIESSIICSDEDFSIAMALADVYIEHALLMFKSLPKSPHAALDNRKRKFYEALPEGRDFPRSEAVAIGKSLKISERSVGDYLKALLGTFLGESEQYGHYHKI